MNFLAKPILRIIYSSLMFKKTLLLTQKLFPILHFLKLETYSFRNLYEGMRPKKRDPSEPGLGRASKEIASAIRRRGVGRNGPSSAMLAGPRRTPVS